MKRDGRMEQRVCSLNTAARMLWRSLIFVSCASFVYSSSSSANEQQLFVTPSGPSQGVLKRYAFPRLQGLRPEDLLEQAEVSVLARASYI